MNLEQAQRNAKAATDNAARLQAVVDGRAAEEREQQKAAEDSRKLLGKFANEVVSRSIADSEPLTETAFTLWTEYQADKAQYEYLALAYDILTHPITGASPSDLRDTQGLNRKLEANLSQVLPGDRWLRSLQTSILNPSPDQTPAQRRTFAALAALEAHETPALEPPRGLSVADGFAARAALGWEAM